MEQLDSYVLLIRQTCRFQVNVVIKIRLQYTPYGDDDDGRLHGNLRCTLTVPIIA